MATATTAMIAAIIIVFFIISFFSYTMNWFRHRLLAQRCTREWGYATYSQFLYQFSRINWDDKNSTDSVRFFCTKDDKISDADYESIVFHDRGMVIRYIEHWRFIYFLYKNKVKNRPVVDWSSFDRSKR